MKKLKLKNEVLLNNFDKSLKRDKSNDILNYDWLKKNKRLYDEIRSDFFNRRIKDLFSDFIIRMNDINEEDKNLFIEGLNKKIKVNKMF